MKKMSIVEAAEYLGVSKEAIHNRIRRGSMQSVVQDGVKFVMVGDNPHATKTNAAQRRRTTVQTDDKYYSFLEEQNKFLQNRIDKLEVETRTVREQKEQMLIDERDKIEQIYKEKDEQLKNILNAISSKFMLHSPQTADLEIKSDDIEAEIEDEEVQTELESNLISLKKYLKQGGYSNRQKEKIKKRFKKHSKKDERIVVVGNKYYVDTKRYDYTNLLNL
ncbi:DNA-binding protein [bacterium]|nr:DNA-binding protein [bacterium]MBU1989919.1 DNA-binding protein [bacterium]